MYPPKGGTQAMGVGLFWVVYLGVGRAFVFQAMVPTFVICGYLAHCGTAGGALLRVCTRLGYGVRFLGLWAPCLQRVAAWLPPDGVG